VAVARATLTRGQREALDVLARVAKVDPGRWVEGHKRSSTDGGPGLGPPRVNMRAAGSLRRKGLVDMLMGNSATWSPYTHDERYRINNVGLEVHRG
jgi:hypothetical protein